MVRWFWLVCFCIFPLQMSHATVFREPDKVCHALERDGLIVIEPWAENGWRDYACATAYLPMSKDSGVPTNLSYYAESEQPDEVMYIRLVLNVNDDGERQTGKKKFINCVTSLFRELGLSVPEELVKAIQEEAPVEIPQDYGSINLEVLRGATNTLRLVVRNQQG